jgi:hypothetical protein
MTLVNVGDPATGLPPRVTGRELGMKTRGCVLPIEPGNVPLKFGVKEKVCERGIAPGITVGACGITTD